MGAHWVSATVTPGQEQETGLSPSCDDRSVSSLALRCREGGFKSSLSLSLSLSFFFFAKWGLRLGNSKSPTVWSVV